MAWLCGFLAMKLATLRTSHRDGRLIVVNRQLSKYVVPDDQLTLQLALDNWSSIAPDLEHLYQRLNNHQCASLALAPDKLAAPLPRAYQWLDGSAYLSHVERVRKARGAQLPPSLLDDPLMYQGASDHMLGSRDSIVSNSESWGIDFEAEVGIITDDVPIGISQDNAQDHIKLLVLINDISLRNLIPDELAKGFGFIQGKPASAFSPVAVTPDELGDTWKNGKLHLPLSVYWNEQLFGNANAGTDMQFSFSRLINHAAKTRRLAAGTIIGSGTVSNYDQTVGCSCIIEKRVIEIIESGAAKSEFMHYGDSVRIEMFDNLGQSIFGSIEQKVKQCP
jgi:fumarylacetoacetate (FAA) hydrolase